MYFKPLALVAVALTPMASALRYAGFSSTVSCDGPNFFCDDGGAVCCGPMPAGFGFSAQFLGLPAGSQGQGYTDACSSFLFAVFGPGDRCWNGGGARATFLNWFHSAGRRDLPARQSNETCGVINGFNYVDDKGVNRSIQVPQGQADTIADLYVKQDFAALAEFPDY